MQAQYAATTATTTGEGEQEHNGAFHSPPTIHTLRLKDPSPTVTTTATTGRTSKKRKVADTPTLVDHQLAHPMIHPHLHHMSQFPFGPVDYSPGGLPPAIPNMSVPGPVTVPSPSNIQQPDQAPKSPSEENGESPKAGRALAQSKRAEQNRKAQRAFRERRDAHVKALESRSQLLDSALASADEANRRWEECRALVDQLRIENAALRQALNQAQLHGHIAPHLTTNPPTIQPSRLTTPSTENKQKDKEKDEKKP